MRCIENISNVILKEFGEFFVAFAFMRRNDLHQTHARDAGFVRKHENEKHVFIDNGVVLIVIVEAGFVQNVIRNDGNRGVLKHACLNQGLVGFHERPRQSMFFVIVHVARIELRNGFISIELVNRRAAQMHNSAVDAVLLYDVCHALNKRMSLVMLHWGVLQKQIVRGICAIQQFMVVGVELFKRGGRAFVFELVNDWEIPHNAQNVWNRFGNARIYGFGRDGEFFGVCEHVEQFHVPANGLDAVR